MFYSGTDKIVRHMLDAPDRKVIRLKVDIT